MYFQAVLFPHLRHLCYICLYSQILHTLILWHCSETMDERYLPVSCLLSFCIRLSNISILNLPLFIPYSFLALQDSEAAAENGNRDTGQGLPFWLK